MGQSRRRKNSAPAEAPARSGWGFAPVALLASFSAVPLLMLLVSVLPEKAPRSLMLALCCLPGALFVNAWAKRAGLSAPRAVLGYYLATMVFAVGVLKYQELQKVDAPLAVPVGYVAFCVAALWLVHRAIGRALEVRPDLRR